MHWLGASTSSHPADPGVAVVGPEVVGGEVVSAVVASCGVVVAAVVAVVVGTEVTLGSAEISGAVVDDDDGVLEHAAITPSRATATAPARLTWR
ncbi:MAG: hypothetical protein ACXWBO_18990 [Ilumatobacteraceae bacterium]